jgi:hypothetical protein
MLPRLLPRYQEVQGMPDKIEQEKPTTESPDPPQEKKPKGKPPGKIGRSRGRESK